MKKLLAIIFVAFFVQGFTKPTIYFAPPSRRKSFGASFGEALGKGIAGFGTGLGSGIEQGLQLVAQQNFQDLQQKKAVARTSKGLEQLGYSPQQAQSLAELPEGILEEVVKQKVREPRQRIFVQVPQQKACLCRH